MQENSKKITHANLNIDALSFFETHWQSKPSDQETISKR